MKLTKITLPCSRVYNLSFSKNIFVVFGGGNLYVLDTDFRIIYKYDGLKYISNGAVSPDGRYVVAVPSGVGAQHIFMAKTSEEGMERIRIPRKNAKYTDLTYCDCIWNDDSTECSVAVSQGDLETDLQGINLSGNVRLKYSEPLFFTSLCKSSSGMLCGTARGIRFEAINYVVVEENGELKKRIIECYDDMILHSQFDSKSDQFLLFGEKQNTVYNLYGEKSNISKVYPFIKHDCLVDIFRYIKKDSGEASTCFCPIIEDELLFVGTMQKMYVFDFNGKTVFKKKFDFGVRKITAVKSKTIAVMDIVGISRIFEY